MSAATKPSPDILRKCMGNPVNTRNVCILAHVDHGKTTIADSLLATNRLVSRQMAGFVRYLDDRSDEQERGITMKSSAVSLLYDLTPAAAEPLLLNLIDTPGHIDFSTEVSAALRVCDGAIIVVDLVEGVCAQTREAIKRALDESVSMVLVLNKFDRLITELHKTVPDIFQTILRVIEDCNALVAEIYGYENLSSVDTVGDIEDADVLFAPESGNVIFASAIDGWGFTLEQIAEMFATKIEGEDIVGLTAKMWNFDCHVDAKSRRIKKGAVNHCKENLFVQLALKTVYHVYSTLVVRMERGGVDVICAKLGLKQITREMRHTDSKIQARAILQAWKPLAHTIMLQCYKCIRPPVAMGEKRICHLLQGKVGQFCEEETCLAEIFEHFKSCSKNTDRPTIAYVSKMFCVSKKNLSQHKPKLFVPTRKKPEENEDVGENDSNKASAKTEANNAETSERRRENVVPPQDEIEKNIMIALARVFSGNLRIGEEVFLLPPSHKPGQSGTVKKVLIKELYILLGRDLLLVDSIEAGNICGIGGLENDVIRTATLSSTSNCLPVAENFAAEPIVRNSIEPANPKDLPKLRKGLHLLMQSDSCVQVLVQESGELVLLTAGDVHLAKCLEDLKTKFAVDVEVNVSQPMVSLRETVVHASKMYNFAEDTSNTIKANIPQLLPFSVEVVATSLPKEIADVIKDNFDLLSSLENQNWNKSFASEGTQKAVRRLREKLKNAFDEVGKAPWPDLHEKIWSVGQKKDAINVLFNLETAVGIFGGADRTDEHFTFDHCFRNAFNTACKAGPICEEPLMNCSFVVRSFVAAKAAQNDNYTPQMMANLEIALKNTFREAISRQNQRLMEPIFVTDIQVTTAILGKVYSVVNKRHGKVLEAVGMDDQEKMFLVRSQIPVVESTGFANEIRKTTSGRAIPSLKFSHYEIIDGDPYTEPVSDDDSNEGKENENTESARRAYNLRREVRRRKGLPVDDEVVVHAEKQRTLNKKK